MSWAVMLCSASWARAWGPAGAVEQEAVDISKSKGRPGGGAGGVSNTAPVYLEIFQMEWVVATDLGRYVASDVTSYITS